MSKHRDAFTQSAEREIEHWPGVEFRFERASKHRRIVLSFNGKERFVMFPSTPSDNARGHLNHIAGLRVELRALGARRVERTPLSERRKRNVAPPRPPEMPRITDPRPDGWVALRELHARISAAAEPPLKPRRSLWAAISHVLTGRAA